LEAYACHNGAGLWRGHEEIVRIQGMVTGARDREINGRTAVRIASTTAYSLPLIIW
jgi:hypothetical protein